MQLSTSCDATFLVCQAELKLSFFLLFDLLSENSFLTRSVSLKLRRCSIRAIDLCLTPN